MRNIVLIGFMGTGKTTIATALANKLKMQYISTDDMIEKKERRTINEIFTVEGEDYFRSVESGIIKEISAMDGVVIDAGGGAVLREENMANFKSRGVIINLTADEDTIFKRTKKYKHRPLLNVEDPKLRIRNLIAKREPYYRKADYIIDTGKLTARQVVERIIAIISNES